MHCVKVSTLLRKKAKILTVLRGPHDLYSPLLVMYMVFSTIVPQAILTSLHPHWPPRWISGCQICSLLWAYVPGSLLIELST